MNGNLAILEFSSKWVKVEKIPTAYVALAGRYEQRGVAPADC